MNDYVQFPYAGYGEMPGVTGFDLALAAAHSGLGIWAWRRSRRATRRYARIGWQVTSAFGWLNAVAAVVKGPLERWRLMRGAELALQQMFMQATAAAAPTAAPAPYGISPYGVRPLEPSEMV